MRALQVDYAHQVRPSAKPARKGWAGLLGGLFALGMVVLFATMVILALAMRVERLEAQVSASKACLSDLHVVLYRTPHDAIAAKVDCPAAEQLGE